LPSFTSVPNCSKKLLKLVSIKTGKCSVYFLDSKLSIDRSERNYFTSANKKGFGKSLRLFIMGSIIISLSILLLGA
jgi:hypothetical protein